MAATLAKLLIVFSLVEIGPARPLIYKLKLLINLSLFLTVDCLLAIQSSDLIRNEQSNKYLCLAVLAAQIVPAFGHKFGQMRSVHGGYPTVLSLTLKEKVFANQRVAVHLAKFMDPATFGAYTQASRLTNLMSTPEDQHLPNQLLPLNRDIMVLNQVRQNGYPVDDLQGGHHYTSKVTREFAALGKMHVFAGPNGPLILSGVAPRWMVHREAVAYCAGLGGGARLPTQDEFFALVRAMGARQPEMVDYRRPLKRYPRHDWDVEGFNPDLIPGLHDFDHYQQDALWSASVDPYAPYKAFILNGSTVDFSQYRERDYKALVRCVR